MKQTAVFLLALLVVVILSGVAGSTEYDPALFTICVERGCSFVCPSGDVSFCFCILYDEQPLIAPITDVWLIDRNAL